MILATLFGVGIPQASPTAFGEPTVWTTDLFLVLFGCLAGITLLFGLGILKSKLERWAADAEAEVHSIDPTAPKPCSYCGRENRAEAITCWECGTAFEMPEPIPNDCEPEVQTAPIG